MVVKEVLKKKYLKILNKCLCVELVVLVGVLFVFFLLGVKVKYVMGVVFGDVCSKCELVVMVVV